MASASRAVASLGSSALKPVKSVEVLSAVALTFFFFFVLGGLVMTLADIDS